MRFTSEQRLDDGVLEREFILGEIPGVLWTAGSASTPAPLILLGHLPPKLVSAHLNIPEETLATFPRSAQGIVPLP